jgi:hypothetical protein
MSHHSVQPELDTIIGSGGRKHKFSTHDLCQKFNFQAWTMTKVHLSTLNSKPFKIQTWAVESQCSTVKRSDEWFWQTWMPYVHNLTALPCQPKPPVKPPEVKMWNISTVRACNSNGSSSGLKSELRQKFSAEKVDFAMQKEIKAEHRMKLNDLPVGSHLNFMIVSLHKLLTLYFPWMQARLWVSSPKYVQAFCMCNLSSRARDWSGHINTRGLVKARKAVSLGWSVPLSQLSGEERSNGGKASLTRYASSRSLL